MIIVIWMMTCLHTFWLHQLLTVQLGLAQASQQRLVLAVQPTVHLATLTSRHHFVELLPEFGFWIILPGKFPPTHSSPAAAPSPHRGRRICEKCASSSTLERQPCLFCLLGSSLGFLVKVLLTNELCLKGIN